MYESVVYWQLATSNWLQTTFYWLLTSDLIAIDNWLQTTDLIILDTNIFHSYSTIPWPTQPVILPNCPLCPATKDLELYTPNPGPALSSYQALSHYPMSQPTFNMFYYISFFLSSCSSDSPAAIIMHLSRFSPYNNNIIGLS